MTRIDLSPFRAMTVGFDSLFNDIADYRPNNYPPYNIRKASGEDNYLIELAVAGFGEEDLTVTVKENNLLIEGDLGEKDSGFVHQGISQRKFSRNFVLAEDVIVKGSDLSNGILTIYAERIVPEEKKPRTIEIGSLKKSEKKQFLSE